MSLFENIVKENFLLLELKQGREADIIKAINSMKRVVMGYDDGKGGKGKRLRFILPVAFGLDKNGKKVIRAYETMGSSKRGLTNPPNNRKHPKWKFFFYDKIYSWNNSTRGFRKFAQQLIDAGLNTEPDGDKMMTKIFAVTPIANKNVPIDKQTIPIDSEPILKPDITQKPKDKIAASKTTDKYQPAEKSRKSSIDNKQNVSYFKNKVEAPETEPTTKADIGGKTATTPVQAQQDNVQQQQMNPTSGPVTKNDIKQLDNNNDVKNDNNSNNQAEKDLKDNELTKAFNDMNNRMDNLYKDEED